MQVLVDTLAVVAMATAAAGVVFGLGWPMLRGVRARGVGSSVAVVLACTLTSVVAGSLLASWQMFISPHDLRVALTILAVTAVVTGAAAWRMASGLRAEAVWADELAARESVMGQGRQELIAFVAADLREPVERLRTLAAEPADGPAAARDARRQLTAEADRLAGLVDDLIHLSHPHPPQGQVPRQQPSLEQGGHESLPAPTSASPGAAPA